MAFVLLLTNVKYWTIPQVYAVTNNGPCNQKIVATGRYAGEGFGLPRLDTLLVHDHRVEGDAGPVRRLPHQAFSWKQEVIVYDYVDIRVLCITPSSQWS